MWQKYIFLNYPPVPIIFHMYTLYYIIYIYIVCLGTKMVVSPILLGYYEVIDS